MDFLYLFKKGVSVYIHPLTVAMELMVIGIVLVGFSRRQKKKKPGKFGKWLRRTSGDFGVAFLLAGVLFLFLSSIRPVAEPLVYLLEKRYPPLLVDELTPSEIGAIAPDFIVVLAGGERFDPEKPPTSQLSYAAAARVSEGARLAHRFPKSLLVFTGRPEEVRAMTETAIALDIPRDRILSESESRDTEDHPRYLKPILGESRFFLVTSGTHMPRSMALFEAQGLEPIAASCDLWVWPRFGEESPYQWDSFVPKVDYLWMTHSAIHEFLGLAWAGLVEARQARDSKESESGDASPEKPEEDSPSESGEISEPPLPLPGEVDPKSTEPDPTEGKPRRVPSSEPVLL